MKTVECCVCGMEFTPHKNLVHTVHEPYGIISNITGGHKAYDAMDCPACGCQKILGSRLPPMFAGDDQDD